MCPAQANRLLRAFVVLMLCCRVTMAMAMAAPVAPPAILSLAASITHVDGVAQPWAAEHVVQGAGVEAWAALSQQLRGTMRGHSDATRLTLAYRIVVNRAPTVGADTWALYLPNLYTGSRLDLNGTPFAALAAPDAHTQVRWLRPGLLTLPDNLWRAGRNELLLEFDRAAADDPPSLTGLQVGPMRLVAPVYEGRRFWVQTMPQITIVLCLVMGVIVTFIWWRRRSEVLYGLFGLAAVLWSIRTAIFVIEVLPTAWWHAWRVTYFTCTGGFIVLLAIFSLRLCESQMPRLERVFLAYWLLGPALLVATRGGLDTQISQWWIAGLIPIGLAVIVFTALAAWRQRSGPAVALFAAVLLAVLSGLHDYLVDWHTAFDLPSGLHQWLSQGIFLLHHSANLLLLVMATILGLRHIEVLEAEARLRRELEARVARREAELEQRHALVATLEREQVVAEERQRIMRDLHDGLGSRMFTTLLRVERGALDMPQVARMLRDCITDMRLIFDVVAPDQPHFADALGGLRFRWEPLLREAQVESQWRFDALEAVATLSPVVTLQLLRIVQESLSNVLRHARATQVRVSAQVHDQVLHMQVEDNGCGFDATHQGGGRGLSNMHSRAKHVGAELDLQSRPGATCVALRLSLAQATPRKPPSAQVAASPIASR